MNVKKKDDTAVVVPSMWQIIRQEIVHDKLALISLIFFVSVILVSFVWAAFFDAGEVAQVHVRYLNLRPGYTEGRGFFILGTDPMGRDVLGQLIVGARNSFLIGFTVALVSSFIGVIIGLFAGYYGGQFDNAVMRVIDFFIIVPTLMIMIVIVTLVEHTPITFGLMLVLFAWTGIARQVRMKTLQQSAMAYVSASKTLGTPNIVIVFREIVPNIISFMMVNMILQIASSMGAETGLTFLGFGLPPGTPSLGTMIANAQNPTILQNRPWQWLPAALLIFLMMLSINYVGQAINRAADAKRRNA